MKFQCAVCGKSAGLLKTSLIYPGVTKGSLEITEGKPICKKCEEKRLSLMNADFWAEIILLMQNDKYYEALEKIEPVYNPNIAEDNYNVANCLNSLKHFEEALEYYNKALFLNTHYVKAWYRKGSSLFVLERFDEASKCFENVIALDKDNENRWLIPAMLYSMLSLIQMHNRTVLAGKKSNLAPQINQLIVQLYTLLSSIPRFDKEMRELAFLGEMGKYEELINKFVDLCIERFHDILDSIEPDIAMEVREPTNKWVFEK